MINFHFIIEFCHKNFYKSCNDVRSKRLKKMKTSLKVFIANMIYKKAWNRVLTLLLSVVIWIISISLIKAYFGHFFYTYIASKVIFYIILRYINAFGKITKKSKFYKNSFYKWVFSEAFYKYIDFLLDLYI